uniref:Glycosyltransferase n=1 Tax=Fervidicoccus fontis TaxID=683846 RepID=A0A7J3SMH3_9CREN
MKVAIIYDFGVNKGGGDFVMLNILEALYDVGYEVSLLTSYAKGLQESAEFFNKPVPNVDICHIKVPSYLRHPYTIAYVARKAIKVGSNTYDAYLVSDDIPKCIANHKGVCYMHYPHAARFNFKEYIATKYKTTLCGKLAWRIHKTLFPRFYLVDRKPEKWLLVANSVVTRRHAAETFRIGVKDIALLNPPVASRVINEMWKNCYFRKENLIACVGRFEFEKQFVEVLQALACLQKKIDVKLSLIGFAYDEKHILKVIKVLRLKESVELLVSADRKTLIDRLFRAKAIVHPAPYEPFGIAVVEGMAAGCIPIVRRGVNGPWLETTEEGKYGFGFSNLEELVGVIEKAVKLYDSFDVETIATRALEFDEAEFKRKFINVFENFSVT